MRSSDKAIINSIVAAGVVDADRELMIKKAQKQLDDDSLSYAAKACIAADLQNLIESRSKFIVKELQREFDEKLK